MIHFWAPNFGRSSRLSLASVQPDTLVNILVGLHTGYLFSGN